MEQFNTNQTVNVDDGDPPLIGKGMHDCMSQRVPEPSSPKRGRASSETSRRGRIVKFRKTYFPDATKEMWNDWHWQVSHRITTLSQISRFLTLTSDEREALEHAESSFPFSVTPYYLSLIDPKDQNSALRKSVVPSILESFTSPGESEDPLHEEYTEQKLVVRNKALSG